MSLSFNPVKVKSSKPKHLQMSEMSMAKYEVGSDVDLDGLDATLPWLSGFTNEATTNEPKLLHKRFLRALLSSLSSTRTLFYSLEPLEMFKRARMHD